MDDTQKVLSNDKFLVQFYEIPLDIAESPIGKDADAIFRKMSSNNTLSMSHK